MLMISCHRRPAAEPSRRWAAMFVSLLAYLILSLSANSMLVGASIAEGPRETYRQKTAPPPRFRRTTSTAEEEAFGCNTVLDVKKPNEVKAFLISLITAQLGATSQATSLLTFNINIFSTYGIRVVRMCASCQDVYDDEDGASSFMSRDESQRYCGPDAYGSDQTFSGLAILPLGEANDDNSTTLRAGTIPGVMDHRTSSINYSPSTYDLEREGSMQSSLLGLMMASMGFPTLLLDYFGYGIGNTKISKGYMIRQSYETASIPLWYKMGQYLQQESDCQTALANDLIAVGYSEGGYAATVNARALFELGWKIEQLYIGGTPAKIGSIMAPGLLESFDEEVLTNETVGDMPSRMVPLLFASAYSSTYRDIANFGMGQDLAKDPLRDRIVDLVNDPPSRAEATAYVENNGGIVALHNAKFVAWARQAYETQDPDPCQTAATFGLEAFCQALQENDITELLETSQYPTSVCHSADDRLVSFANVPNVTGNENLTLTVESGSHNAAFLSCMTNVLISLPAFGNKLVEAKHSDFGCPVTAFSPSTAPPSTAPFDIDLFATELPSSYPPSSLAADSAASRSIAFTTASMITIVSSMLLSQV